MEPLAATSLASKDTGTEVDVRDPLPKQQSTPTRAMSFLLKRRNRKTAPIVNTSTNTLFIEEKDYEVHCTFKLGIAVTLILLLAYLGGKLKVETFALVAAGYLYAWAYLDRAH